jgi:hypothetical protein
MKVALAFWREHDRTPDSLPYMMYGKYSSCGFVFVGADGVEIFYSVQGGKFERYTLQRCYNQSDYEADFLLLSVDEDEKHRLKATCEACARVGKPFNLLDVVLMYVPFTSPKELRLEEAPTLNNTQAAILFLRECLNRDNPLREAVADLHSRQTFIDALYERLCQHALPVLWSSLAGHLLRGPAVEGSVLPQSRR